MKNYVPSNVARIIFALVFAVFGIFHFMNAGDMAGMVPTYMPGGSVWVYLTGIALIGYAVSSFIGKYEKLAGYLLAIMLILFVLLLHLPGASSNPMLMSMALKDLALAMAAIYIANSRE